MQMWISFEDNLQHLTLINGVIYTHHITYTHEHHKEVLLKFLLMLQTLHILRLATQL